MTGFAALRPKIYSYLRDDNNENKEKKGIKKGIKKCTVKIKLKFEDHKHYLEATQLES